MAPVTPRPLIAHVLYRFDVGGLENGVVNLINHLPGHRFRHAVIAMTEVSDFRNRIQRDDVEFFSLKKPPGQGLKIAPAMYGLLRRLAPAIVHTRNLGALEMSLPAALARVPVRIHGEHGWDSTDPDGRSRKFRMVRRFYTPFVHRYVALSRHLERYLADGVGVATDRIEQIYNGVDTGRFVPASTGRSAIRGSPFASPGQWLIGTVGRLETIKDQTLLARAFARAVAIEPRARDSMRLIIAGDGPLRPQIEQILRAAGVESLAWMAGVRNDVPDVLRGLDAFVLPSLAEGISNTLLEAMATGLPIVATAVGGNVELLEGGVTGRLVSAGDVEGLAIAMLEDWKDPGAARARGVAARTTAQQRFSLESMVGAYGDLYDRLLLRATDRGALQRA